MSVAVRQAMPALPAALASLGDRRLNMGAVDLNAQVAAHLSERGFVPFHPAMAERFGYRVALFIGVALYWTRHGLQHAPQRGGWFHMSARQMSDATTLTRHEQDTVRATLKAQGILQEQLAGRPAVIHYRLNLRGLVKALEVLDDPPENVSVEHAWSWFRQCVSFYRPLADLAGSAAGGLYLSYLLRQQRVAIQARQLRADETIRLDPADILDALKLTPKVIRTTRERLRKAGLISESGTHFVRVNMPAILACIEQQTIQPMPARRHRGADATGAGQHIRDAAESKPSAKPAAKPSEKSAQAPERRHLLAQHSLGLYARQAQHGTGIGSAWELTGLMLGSKVAGFPQPAASAKPQAAAPAAGGHALVGIARSGKLEAATVAQTGKLEPREVAQSGKLGCPIRHTGLPNPATHIQQQTTTTTTTAREAPPVDNSAAGEAGGRRRSWKNEARGEDGRQALEGLVFPDGLDPAFLPGIHDVLLRCDPALRQPLLDELQGQLNIPGKRIHNPVGWLSSVARKAAQGSTLALADAVAAQRAQQQAVKLAVAAAAERTQEPPPTAAPIRASDSEEGRKGLQRIHELRNEMARKAGVR